MRHGSRPARPHRKGPQGPNEARPRKEGKRGPKRLFEYGELRLLILAMIAQSPRHGYEIIKAIEERFNGAYCPSPGVIYPSLSWLEEIGYIRVEPDENARKLSRITAEGEAFIEANRAAADELLTRTMPPSHRANAPEEIVAAMDDIKLALRQRLAACNNDASVIEALAETLRQTAHKIASGAK
ncbi:PadR family transcriptional regulator [Salipiger bermudensis]|uniref:PadR family transcriptional regulator n=1 Tax=Salipiger bermudensis TaxID=344736 RepID=UPI0021BDB067|nr:PadR family transcriptional regulator [Salipiger bermudensis]